ncbi:biopolymer transporter ExbD [Flavobacterium rivuli WB 3.3-2 = DSM 21788]|uniref:Biopolymer transporter ExbD n=1 Tax=Flavobacterium rivuli WB 3.3-2 = DSM 21788 TaxID=1121895 RepID=A0A0A2M188_9FLAO|nr:biopolymer transporter ExbD [Flavobacterium rivuli]KGO85193.1 biopolymer transporter ExbD [Flavobacterium rivuli WB 3.3-2 = DSM 21788]
MAELNTGGGSGDGKKVRSKKSNPGVDLTAMVDLAFLLITFFMLTTTLSKPQSMPLAMPDKNPKDQVIDRTPIPEDRMMTILIGKDNKILWYMGILKTPRIQPTEAAFGKDGIRREILKNTAYAKKFTDKADEGLIVNIKASDAASYKNLVDILDEMAINKVQLYAIGDITPEEVTLLKDKGLY